MPPDHGLTDNGIKRPVSQMVTAMRATSNSNPAVTPRTGDTAANKATTITVATSHKTVMASPINR